MKRGMEGLNAEALGGDASVGGRHVFCGPCSPEPLSVVTAVRLKVRKIGERMECFDGFDKGVDILECPSCGHQIIR